MKIVIIGAGPAGEAAAKTAARLGKRDVSITLIEKEEAGGLCLNKGCVPSKTLLEQVRGLAESGKTIEWTDIQAAKERVVTTIRGQLESSLKTLKINLVRGTARFASPNSIEVTGVKGPETLEFDKAIIATGTEALFPPPFDRYRDRLLDSDRMLMLTHTPKSVIIVGGGAVGCEFACLLNAAGAQVTIVELKDGILPGEDAAIVSALTTSFENRGITIKTGVRGKDMEPHNRGWKLKLSNDEVLEAENILVCIGRAPALGPLNLDAANIKTDKGRAVTDEQLRTTNLNVFVAGDAGTTRLAHAAAFQGEAAASTALGQLRIYDGRFVPRCLYSWPEVASVGAWKYELDEKNVRAKASRAFFKGSAKAMAADEADGFVQLVTDESDGKLLGAQIIGPHATELIHVISVALKAEMTTKQLGEVMFAHPTLSEVIRDAARK